MPPRLPQSLLPAALHRIIFPHYDGCHHEAAGRPRPTPPPPPVTLPRRLLAASTVLALALFVAPPLLAAAVVLAVAITTAAALLPAPQPPFIPATNHPTGDNEQTELTELLFLRVAAILDRQQRQHRQYGVALAVYLDGRCVLNATAGAGRAPCHRGWQPITPSHLFMPYSVTKGVTASLLLTLADRGQCDYKAPVTSIWPAFALPHDPTDKHLVTVEELLSHRAALPTMTPGFILTQLYLIARHAPAERLEATHEHGQRYVERLLPEYLPRSLARYHSTTFSFISSGLVRHLTGGRFIQDVCRENIAQPLNRPDDIYLGSLPDSQVPRLAVFEHTRGLWARCRGLLHWLLVWGEMLLFVAAARSRPWREICLPSSNLFATAEAMARLYGCLANGGVLADGTRLVRRETVDDLLQTLRDPALTLPPDDVEPSPARMSRGFLPFIDPQLHEPDAFGHSGMGGCTAFAEPSLNLGICIMKNIYEPVSLDGSSTTPAVVELVQAIKDEVRRWRAQ